jgi:glycosyltransferase involved in cell wall biosynthesis
LRRPKLLLRALDSVFSQTFRDIEVIAVVDGPDDETITALAGVADHRLRILQNPKSLTAAGARNAGAAQAKGEWIAFLDDDDEWLPQKLERQIAHAAATQSIFITCLSQVVTPIAVYVWPETIYRNDRALDEYLFDRKTIFSGSAFIQTSSYFLPRAVFMASPFRLGTPHDDWDFILRLARQPGVRIETVPEVLVRLHAEQHRPSLSSADAWQKSLQWLDSIRPILTPRGYSGLCLGVVGPRAASEHAYAAFFPLLYKAFRYGSPRPLHLLAYAAFWIVPRPLRQRLRGAAKFRGALSRLTGRAGEVTPRQVKEVLF